MGLNTVGAWSFRSVVLRRQPAYPGHFISGGGSAQEDMGIREGIGGLSWGRIGPTRLYSLEASLTAKSIIIIIIIIIFQLIPAAWLCACRPPTLLGFRLRSGGNYTWRRAGGKESGAYDFTSRGDDSGPDNSGYVSDASCMCDA
jgi:hypothetical protein